MGRKKRKPWIYMIYFLLLGFIIFGPLYFIKYKPMEDINDNGKKDENHWKGVITLWDYPRNSTDGTRYGWMMDKIKKFEKENPGVFIELKPIHSETGPIELETAIKMKNYPDIAPVATEYSIISQNLLEPMDSYLSRDEIGDYKSEAVESVTYHGKIWGFPVMMSTYTMVLNMDLFREKGVKPPRDGNWTYDEFVKTLKSLTFDRDGDRKIDVYGFNSFIGLNDYNTWGILLSDGAELFDEDGSYEFNDNKAKSGLKKLIDLKFLHRVTPKNFGENSKEEAWESFYKEKKVAVYPTGTWAINVLNNLKNQGEGFDFEVANYPIGKRGEPISMGKNVTAYGIFKQKDKEKLKMCVKFLKFITQDEYQKQLDQLGTFPVKKGNEEIYKNDPIMKRIEKSLEYSKNIPSHPNWITIEGIIQNEIKQVLQEKKQIDDALKDAEEKIIIYSKKK